MKHLYLYGIFFTLSLYANAQVQDTVQMITMEQAVAAAVSGNMSVKMAATDEAVANAKYRQTAAIYLPQVGFSYTAFSTNNPLNAFGFKLQQQSISASDFNPTLLNHPGSTTDFTTKLDLQQPIVNMDMYYQRKAAGMQIDMYKLQTARSRDYAAFETKKVYLQLQLAYDADKVLREALETAKALHRSANDYFQQGLIQRSDVLNAEVHVMGIETQLKQSGSNILNASDILSMLMGKEAGTVYKTTQLATGSEWAGDSTALTVNRADFSAMQKGIESYDIVMKATKMSHLPRLNAFASYQLNDNRMLGFGSKAYLAGIQLSWNIFNGNREKKLLSQQAAEKDKMVQQLQQLKEQSQVQINQAIRQLSDASFSMKQHLLAVSQSTEVLRVLQNRYVQGLVKTSDVLMAQTQLSEQRLGYVHAVYQHQLAITWLEFLTANSQ